MRKGDGGEDQNRQSTKCKLPFGDGGKGPPSFLPLVQEPGDDMTVVARKRSRPPFQATPETMSASVFQSPAKAFSLLRIFASRVTARLTTDPEEPPLPIEAAPLHALRIINPLAKVGDWKPTL
jgi:hypothetical protein